MSSLSSDVSNAVWHAYTHHENRKGHVQRKDLADLVSHIGHVVGAPLVAHTLTLHHQSSLRFGQLMCFLEKELFAPFQASCDVTIMHKTRDLIEEACWREYSQSILGTRSVRLLPERAIYHIFRVFCFLAELQTDKFGADKVLVQISADEAEEICKSFVQSLGGQWDPIVMKALPLGSLNFETFLDFIETNLAFNQDPRGLAEAAAEIFDIYIGDIIKKGAIKRKHFAFWWEYLMIVRPHFLQFYTSKGKKIQEFQLTSNSQVGCASISKNPLLESVSILPNGGSQSCKSHKFFVIINTRNDEEYGKIIELNAPCYKSKVQWMNAIKCAIVHSQSQRSYQSFLASQRKIARLERRAREESKQTDIERIIRSRIEEEIDPLRQEISSLEERVLVETQAKRDEEIVRGAQSRLLLEEWEKMEKLQAELDSTKRELVKVKSETISFRKRSVRRPKIHRAKSLDHILDSPTGDD